MRSRLSALLFGFALIVPVTASALQTTVWNFTNSDVPGNWEISRWDRPTQTKDGLHIKTMSEGFMMRETKDLTHGMDAVSFTVIANAPVSASLLWQPRNTPGMIGQLPFQIKGTGQPETIHVSGSGLGGWDEHPLNVGLQLPGGSDVLLQGIGIHHWNPYEKVWEITKSFWKFDAFLPYSINFLWGPITNTNPIATEHMYDALPARGHSGVWLFYGALVLAGAIALLRSRTNHGRQVTTWFSLSRSGALFLGVAAACWLIFDLRMGLEYLSFVRTDYRTYISHDLGQRTFRNMENVHDVMLATAQYVRGAPFVYVSPVGQVRAVVRYLTYPSIPLPAESAPPETKYWLVFREPGASLDAEGRLTINGQPVSNPGKIVGQFDATSFLFETL